MSNPLHHCQICYSYSTPYRKVRINHPVEVLQQGPQEGFKVDSRRNTQPHLLCVPYQSHRDRRRARSLSHSQEGCNIPEAKKPLFTSLSYSDSHTVSKLGKETFSLTTTDVWYHYIEYISNYTANDNRHWCIPNLFSGVVQVNIIWLDWFICANITIPELFSHFKVYVQTHSMKTFASLFLRILLRKMYKPKKWPAHENQYLESLWQPVL